MKIIAIVLKGKGRCFIVFLNFITTHNYDLIYLMTSLNYTQSYTTTDLQLAYLSAGSRAVLQ